MIEAGTIRKMLTVENLEKTLNRYYKESVSVQPIPPWNTEKNAVSVHVCDVINERGKYPQGSDIWKSLEKHLKFVDKNFKQFLDRATQSMITHRTAWNQISYNPPAEPLNRDSALFNAAQGYVATQSNALYPVVQGHGVHSAFLGNAPSSVSAPSNFTIPQRSATYPSAMPGSSIQHYVPTGLADNGQLLFTAGQRFVIGSRSQTYPGTTPTPSAIEIERWVGTLQTSFHFRLDSSNPAQDREDIERLGPMLQKAIEMMNSERRNGRDVTPLQNEINRCLILIENKKDQIRQDHVALNLSREDPQSNQELLTREMNSLYKNWQQFESLSSGLRNGRENSIITSINQPNRSNSVDILLSSSDEPRKIDPQATEEFPSLAQIGLGMLTSPLDPESLGK